ncbi:ETX/MTX2 family pore-forming toxin [Streptomyces sp. NBUL23]|uniref:ETX/MTX2 family pore-forming toxin n=1 Tax=Streptomyces sp. NBUL23 TaxID=3381354 RepID=UPI00387273AA
MTNYLERILTGFITKYPPKKGTVEEVVKNALGHTKTDLLGDVTLGTPQMKSTGESMKLYSQEYTNDSSVEQSQTLKFGKDVQRSLTVSKTKTFEASQEISMEVKLEGFGSMGGKIGFKEGQSSTESETKSVTERWEVDNPIRVPPHKTVIAVVYVDEGELSVDYEGRAHLYFHAEVGTIEYGSLLSALDTSTQEKKAYYGLDLGDQSAPDSPRYRLDGSKLIGRASGTLSAKAGVKVRTVVTEKEGQDARELEVIETLPGATEAARLAEALAVAFD